MNRDALIVGINKYPFFKVNGKVQNLTTPANDAEKIAHILETKGEFRVRRLPVKLREGNHQIDSDSTLNKQELQDAIGQLFNPEGENAPHTALLYFIGHGLREVSYGVTEGFLATSDVNPGRNQWGVRLKWLRELLQKSPVKEQIIWLDCCYAGELFNFTEADLGTGNKEQTRFFIAASREYELAEANVFSRTLLAGLNPNNYPEGLVNNDTLISYLKEHLKNAPQQPIFANPSQQILLTGTQGETIFTRIDGDCPYKGLLFFDVDDADYFYGRERLTQELIDKVQVGKANFLAVLGVSGSGKSSLLRAGLIYQLQHKDRLPQTQSWKISIFTPGEKPLDSLAIAFLEKEWTDGQRYEELQKVKRAIDKGATRFADYINVSQAPRTLLIVDQFEEVFTVCKSPQDRNHFITTLLGALPETGDKLCLIFAMRDDFLGKCAAYQELATLIQSNLLMVTPMNEGELRDAIEKPATKLGRKVEHNLIDVILKDLRVESSGEETPEAEPGLLPLLSYTLEQLWYRQTLNWLRLESYKELGGVRKILENLEEEAYKELSETEQRIADRIFIKLTNLGEGTPDTRKQVSMDALVSLGESEEIVEQVVQKLADARLIVTHNLSVPDSSKSQEKKNVIVIDVAHEALIRYWGRLQELLENNRDAIRTEGKIQTAAEEWEDKGKSQDYLLTGLRLGEAEEFLQDESKIVPLSVLAKELIEESRKESDRLELEQKRRRRNTIFGLTGGLLGALLLAGISGWQWRQAQIGQIEALSTSSKALFSTDPIASLIDGLKAAKKLKQTFGANTDVKAKVRFALLQAVYSIRENNLLENHKGNVNDIAFSPDGKYFASVGGDGTLRLWNSEGKEIKVWWGDNARLLQMSFSPDGKLIALADENGMIKLWSVPQERIVKSFTGEKTTKGYFGYQNQVTCLNFSPDGKIIVSASSNGVIKLWNLNGKEIRTIKGHDKRLINVKFSNDGKIIGSASSNGVIKLWDLNGKEILTQKNEQVKQLNSIYFIPNSSGTVWSFAGGQDGVLRLWDTEDKLIGEFPKSNDSLKKQFSGISSVHLNFNSDTLNKADQMTFAVGYNDGTVRIWRAGEFTTLGKHKNIVNSIKFSNDGKIIASASDDGTIKIWNLDRPKPYSFIGYQGDIGVDRFLHFSRNGKIIITGTVKLATHKNIIRVWKMGSVRSTFFITREHRLASLDFSSKGEKIALGFENGVVKIFNLEGQELAGINKGESPVNSLKFSPDGKTIVFGSSDGTVKVWNIGSQKLRVLGKHNGGSVQSVNFSPDGKIIASGGGDSTIKVWNLEGKELYTLKGHISGVNSISFSPDGKIIASAGNNDKIIKLWSIKGQEIGTLWGHDSRINSLSFDLSGKMLVSGGGGKVKLWLLGDSTPITLVSSPSSDESTTQFSLYGNKLASNVLYKADEYNNAKAKMWDLKIDTLQSQGCYWIYNYLKNNPNLGKQERQICEGVKESAHAIFEQGIKEAKEGNISEAVAKFKKASEISPGLVVDPEKEAIYIRASTLFDLAADKLLSPGWKDIEGVDTILTQATKLELMIGTLNFNYEERARDLLIRGLLKQVQLSSAQKYGLIAAMPDWKNSIDSLMKQMLFPSAYHICWVGTIYSHASEALDACDKIVEFEPEPGRFRGIRGMARAMNSDFEGAIEDFEANIDWINNDKTKTKYTQESLDKLRQLRKSWIDELRAGKNPIKSLKPEEIEKMSQIRLK